MDDFVIDCLATFRLARLISQDTFPPVQKLRQAVWRRWPPAGTSLQAKDGWNIGEEHAVRYAPIAGVKVRTKVKVVGTGMVADGHPLGELAGCPWCLSPWLAAGIFGARRYMPSVWGPVAKVLAASAVAGIVAESI